MESSSIKFQVCHLLHLSQLISVDVTSVKCCSSPSYIVLSVYSQIVTGVHTQVKEALSVLMLCAPVFIFTSGSSALLGRPRCGLSIWLLLLAIFNTLFWVYTNFFLTRKWKKNMKILKFSYHTKMAANVNTGAQSINTESLFKTD